MEYSNKHNNTENSGNTSNGKRFQGRVKWFNKRRGFGFIANLDTDVEVFAHHTGIKPKTECWRVLFEGEYVEFDEIDGRQGKQAINITGIRGGQLRCDVPPKNMSQNDPHEVEHQSRDLQGMEE